MPTRAVLTSMSATCAALRTSDTWTASTIAASVVTGMPAFVVSVETTELPTRQSNMFQPLFELCPLAAPGMLLKEGLPKGKCGEDVGEVARRQGGTITSQVAGVARNNDFRIVVKT